jgi:hypothetical protein
MIIDWYLVVEAIKALAWPVVAGVVLFALRRPIIEVIAQIAKRAQKISIFEVSIEFAMLPELGTSWVVGNSDLRQLTSAYIFDSASQSLFQELLKPTQADYAVVDLRSGNAWLTSRLFLFSIILGEIRGLRGFVFLETTSDQRRRFLGFATPTAVRRGLGSRYPWLEEAFAKAIAAQYPDIKPPEMPQVSKFSNMTYPLQGSESWPITNVVRKFIEELQRTTDPPPQEQSSYLEIESTPKSWERAGWLNGERLERALTGGLSFDWVTYSPDLPQKEIVDSVIRRNSPFVALVDSDRRFLGLVDRLVLLNDFAKKMQGKQE